MQTLQQKPQNLFELIQTIFTTLRYNGVRLRISCRGLAELRHTAILDLRLTARDLVIAPASVGVARTDLIEHVIERLPIVHLAIQTA